MNTVNLGKVRGEPFTIDKTYSSIEEMNNSFLTDDVKKDHFVVINTGNVEDEDNGKLYRKDEDGYTFIVDMSGKKGENGEKGDPGDIGDFSTLYDGTEVKTTSKIPIEQDGIVKKYTVEDVTKDKLSIKNPIAEGVLKTKANGSSDIDSFFVINSESADDVVTGTPAKTVKIDGNQINPLNFEKRYFNIPDMAGARRYTLIADITHWWDADTNITGLTKTGFIGTITASRPSNNSNADLFISTVSAIVAYKKSLSSQNCLNLKYFTSIYTFDEKKEQFKPCVISYNNKKYLALLIIGSSVDVEMSGAMYNLLPEFTTVLETDIEVLVEGTSLINTDTLTVSNKITSQKATISESSISSLTASTLKVSSTLVIPTEPSNVEGAIWIG